MIMQTFRDVLLTSTLSYRIVFLLVCLCSVLLFLFHLTLLLPLPIPVLLFTHLFIGVGTGDGNIVVTSCYQMLIKTDFTSLVKFCV